jgi:hypothetical protein
VVGSRKNSDNSVILEEVGTISRPPFGSPGTNRTKKYTLVAVDAFCGVRKISECWIQLKTQ